MVSAIIDKLKFARGSLMIEARSKDEAREYVLQSKLWANKFNQDVLIFYPKCKSPYKICSEENINMSQLISSNLPELYLGETKVYSRTFLQTLLELRERKDDNAGIVRLRDNQQIVLTAGSATAMNMDVSPLTKLRREDYWNLEDLTQFNREWQQTLREDGSNSFEFTYRALNNPLDKNSGWVRQTTRYNLFVDGSELYHRASVLDVMALV